MAFVADDTQRGAPAHRPCAMLGFTRQPERVWRQTNQPELSTSFYVLCQTPPCPPPPPSLLLVATPTPPHQSYVYTSFSWIYRCTPCQEGILWAGVGSGLFGLFMASTYPLAMSLLPSAGEFLRDLTMCTPRIVVLSEERETHPEKEMRQKVRGRSSCAGSD